MKRVIILILFLMVAAGMYACSDDNGSSPEKPKSCSSVADCDTGQICAGGSCSSCSADVQCEADYGVGAKCETGKCVPPSCVPGTIGCPCLDDSSCNEGECINDECVDCERGTEGCTCLNNGTCNKGFRCGENNLCEVCPAGEKDCPCKEDSSCNDDLVCSDDDVCIENPCPDGEEGCPCAEGNTCNSDDLYCSDNSTCQQCSNDIEGCPCDEEDKCENKLVCDEESKKCRKPKKCDEITCLPHQLCSEPEDADAFCLEDCEEGWHWDADTASCVENPPAPNCQPGAPGSILEQCDSQNRVCVEEENNAHCGDCKDFFIDEDGSLETCRAVHTCSDLACENLHRICNPETATSDAECADCFDGYVEEFDQCFELNCDPSGSPGTIVDECNDQHRTCVDSDEEVAHCGACVEGYAENENGECQEMHTCGPEDLDCAGKYRTCEGEAPFQYCGDCFAGTAPDPNDPERCTLPLTCADLNCEDQGLFCVEGGPGENAHCVDRGQCGENEAWSDFSNRCVTCVVSCPASVEGLTGRIWPFTLANSDRCICETERGYYWEEGVNRGVRPCDADNDGWVRDSARYYVESDDPTLRQNARCDVKIIDRFVLENEWNQRMEVLICNGDKPLVRKGERCDSPKQLPLYEAERNDDAVQLYNEISEYAVNGVGRKLRPEELNSLTKVCSAGGDYNDNGKSDISEWHNMPTDSMSEDMAIFTKMSYYVELARGWYEHGTETIYGKYVISERSRCDDDFPIKYPDTAGDYWRQCTRSRDAAYNGNDPDPDFGMDFAEWSCDATSGSCPVPPPPTNEQGINGQVPQHGLCEVTLPPIDDECSNPDGSDPWYCIDGSVWRGMSHHSQFKCVVVSNETSNELPYMNPNEIVSGNYVFNKCHVDCPADDPTCANDDCASADGQCSSENMNSSEASSWSPKISCEIESSPDIDSVGFAAAMYLNAESNDYIRGCINEWHPVRISGEDMYGVDDPITSAWRTLCSGWSDHPASVVGQGDSTNFGKIQCACGTNYGGLNCEIGCPTLNLHVSPDFSANPREGFWMCADMAASAYSGEDPIYGPASVGADDSNSEYILRGEIPYSISVSPVPLCENPDDCSTGFSIR